MIFSRFKWDEDKILECDSPQRAFLYHRHVRYNLLTGFPETYPIQNFQKELENISLQEKVPETRVYHFYYEWGLLQNGLGHLVKDDTPLVLEIFYKRTKKITPKKTKLTYLPLQHLERPTWTEYKSAFLRIQEHLLSGNCYQVNLTYPFDFQTEDYLDPRDICDFFFSQKKLGAFAHATFFGENMFLSNSPECLFQYRDNKIFTMPIKGTKKLKGDWKKTWKEMLKDPKEEGELLMIADLLKNDLNRLDGARAQVIKKRAPLLVPGLLHQYSLLSLKLNNPVSLLKTLTALFPGGSITGAPKKRVMEIINEVERDPRGIYCGSTLLCYGDKKMASINIRTADINLEQRLWRFGAGGGITLLSKPVDEFNEMESKVRSFLTLIKAPGY